MTKEGYQPIKTKKTIKIIPPNTSSNVQKKDGYTWEDLDKAWWEGFDNAKNKMEKRITELEKENAELKEEINKIAFARGNLEEENAELRKVAEFQQSSNMDTHLENKKLKEGLAVGSTFNKALNSMNKYLEEERDKYRNMVFDQREHLTKAKEIIRTYMLYCKGETQKYKKAEKEAEQFLSEVEK